MNINLEKRNGWKSKGFTLIETMASVVISVMLYLIITSLIIGIGKNTESIYAGSIEDSKFKHNLENLKIYLNDDNNIWFSVEADKLIIKKYSNENNKMVIDEISHYDNRLILRYYRDEDNTTTSSTILYNVEGLDVVEKENLIYMIIKVRGKEYYVRV